jgi:hypothetical protein
MWLIFGLGIVIAWNVARGAETNAVAPATTSTNKDSKVYYALEKLIVEPQEIGLDAKRTIDGMVINLKSPVKIIANDNEMRVTSSQFRDKNLRFAGLGMHSWMSVTYKISEENEKAVTLYVMEFESTKLAKRFVIGETRVGKEEDEDKEFELKGSIFYQFLHGPILLKVTWPEPKTAGIDRIIAAYKAKMLLM